MCYSTELVPRREASGARDPRWILALLEGRPPIHYASAFTQPFWPVVTAGRPDEVLEHRWGLVPAWAEDPKAFLRKTPTFNAISETAFEKPSFRGALKAGRRCLVPVTGFFEWMHVGRLTYPHRIHVRSRHLFCLAGIHENGTYSILTCPANALMARIHNSRRRMPVILPAELERAWLAAGMTKEEVLAMCVPYPDDDMEAWTVSRRITSRSEDPNTPQAAEPVTYPELEAPARPA